MITSGEHAGLAYDLATREGVGDGATVAVLLHGRGSHKGDLQALGPLLPAGWALVTPQAPYPGAAWGYGPGWAWYRYVEEDRLDEATLADSLGRLDGFLADLPRLLGFAPGRVVLGGFSQGGTTSLSHALTRPGLVSAALNFSGFLPSSVEPPDAVAGVTPLFWGHGVRDPNIPHALAERGRRRLEHARMPLVSRDYEIGHWIVPEEVHDAVAVVEAAGRPGG